MHCATSKDLLIVYCTVTVFKLFEMISFAGECMDFTLRLVNNVRRHPLRAFDPTVVIDKILRNSLEQVLPQNAHKLCSGRLFVSVTKLRGLAPPDFENEIISQFETREDLIQVIQLSCVFAKVFKGEAK